MSEAQRKFRYGSWFYDYEEFDERIKDAKYIQPLEDADFSSSTFCSDYFVSSSDVEALKTYCANAGKNDENVYLLRFAYSDCYTENVWFDLTAPVIKAKYNIPGSTATSETEILLIQEDVYLDFDIIQLGFSDDGENVTTIAVTSSPVDVFTGIVGLPGVGRGDDVDFKDLLQKIVAVFLIVVFVGVVIWIIGLFGELGQASTNRQILRELRRRNRK